MYLTSILEVQYFQIPLHNDWNGILHYGDVIMGAMASQITGLTIVYSIVYSGADKKHQSSALLAFVQGNHRWPVNSPRKLPVTRKLFPFDDAIMVMYKQTNITMMTSWHGTSFYMTAPLLGNPAGTDEFLRQWPLMHALDGFFVASLHTLLLNTSSSVGGFRLHDAHLTSL